MKIEIKKCRAELKKKRQKIIKKKHSNKIGYSDPIRIKPGIRNTDIRFDPD